MLQGFVGLGVRARGVLLGGALPWFIGCSVEPGSVRSDEPEPQAVAATTQALGSNLQGVYVVSSVGNDGTCDDAVYTGSHAAALQACIDRANTDGGGTVLVRAGTYSTGTWPVTVKSNVTLTGQGHVAAKLAPTGAGGILLVQDHATVLELNFDQTNVASLSAAIRFGVGSHSDVRIENNLFTSTNTAVGNYYGVYSTLSSSFSRIIIRGNSFQIAGSGSAAYFPISLQATSGTMDYVRVESNDIFLNSSSTGSYISLNAGPSSVASRGMVVSGNTMRSTAGSIPTGIMVTGAYDAQITGNAIQALTSTILLAAGASGSCGATITANDLRGGHVDIGTCYSNSLLAANTQNGAPTAGMGRAAVVVRAYANGVQTFTAGTDTPVAFGNEDADYGGNFDTTSSTFTAPSYGVYRIHACVRFMTTNFAAGDTADLALRVNTTNWAVTRAVSGGTSGFTTCTEDLLVLATGDSVQAVANASGAATTRTITGAKSFTYFGAERISDQ
jgi:hypothetical protein